MTTMKTFHQKSLMSSGYIRNVTNVLTNLNCNIRLPIVRIVIFGSNDKIMLKVKIDIYYKFIILVTYDNNENI